MSFLPSALFLPKVYEKTADCERLRKSDGNEQVNETRGEILKKVKGKKKEEAIINLTINVISMITFD